MHGNAIYTAKQFFEGRFGTEAGRCDVPGSEFIAQDAVCREKIEYSSCSWISGWNIKFKKAGKTLCTVYPQEGYVTVMTVVGRKEKEAVENILPVRCILVQSLIVRSAA